MMAKFFNLASYPNQSIKSKTNGNFLRISGPPRGFIVPEDWDVKPGDVISWNDYRASETYFVTTTNSLLKNPDTSGAGYLTIPISITSNYASAVEYYSSVLNAIDPINVFSIELLPTDKFFMLNFSKRSLPKEIIERDDISYSYEPQNEMLTVIYRSNPEIFRSFSLTETTTDEIIEWISYLGQPRSILIVNYHLKGESACQNMSRSQIQRLPAGWQCDPYGSCSGGSDYWKGQWKCHGPETSKQQARRAIEEFYQNQSIELDSRFISIEEFH